MKKLLMISFLLLGGLSVTAQSAEKIDASKVRQITFQGDEVTIKYNDGTEDMTFDMAAVIIDFSNTTSIEERIAVTTREGLEGKTVYNLKGQRMGNSAACLAKGIYIIAGKKVVIK